MTAEAEVAAGAAEVSQRRTRPHPGRCQDLPSTDTRSCSAGSCAIPDVIASAREDAALSTTENMQLHFDYTGSRYSYS